MQSRSDQSRVRILAAARAALVAGGGDFELADLARRAGVSVGLPYHRFGSKSGVVAAVVTDFYDGLRRAIDLGDSTEKEWGRREHERLRRLVGYLYADPISVVVIATLARAPDVAAVETSLWNETIAAAARNLRAAQRRGHVPRQIDPALAAAMICGGVRHAVGLALAEQPRRDSGAVVGELWAFIAQALRLPERPGTRQPTLAVRVGRSAAQR